MPVAAKSYMPTFLGFMAFALTYTAVVAAKEGAAVDAARTRWQDQHARARNALSGGMTLQEVAGK